MRDSFIAFYTDARVQPIRFLFYACFAVIASAYIAINRLVFSRSEYAVSLEVAGLLTAMVVGAPIVYQLIERARSRTAKERRMLVHEHLRAFGAISVSRAFLKKVDADSLILNPPDERELFLETAAELLEETFKEARKRTDTRIQIVISLLGIGTIALTLVATTLTNASWSIVSVTLGVVIAFFFGGLLARIEKERFLQTIEKTAMEILLRTLRASQATRGASKVEDRPHP